MSSWNHHTTPALGIHCMYCSLRIAQKAQQNRRGQIKGNEIRGRNLGMFGVKKKKKKAELQSTGRRQVLQTVAEMYKKGDGGRQKNQSH